MPRKRRLLTLLPALALALAVHAPVASASTTQVSLFQDDVGVAGNPATTLSALKTLGVSEVRETIYWKNIAPSKKPKNASSPAAYSASAWAPYDNIVKIARTDGITVEFDIAQPAPPWAEGAGPRNKGSQYKPNAADFGAFVKAVGTRYDGHYDGLPKVTHWSIWNEPNYITSLSPESTDNGNIVTAAMYYRSLVDAAWGALNASGHRGNTILFGELAPHGYFHGDEGLVAPLTFLRALYCVSSSYHHLTGAIARGDGCPTTSAGYRRFRSQNSVLFSASGFAMHLYAQGTPPDATLTKPNLDTANDADLARVGSLERTLDKLNRTYGSHKKFPIWNTEYGYQTDPPEPLSAPAVTTATAAYYINWAEYISYKNPRIASYDQYLLQDPPASAGLFDSGLEFADGSPKPDYQAYQIPLYMPQVQAKKPSVLTVWGGARPSHFGGSQNALIEFTPTGGSATYTPVKLHDGYFDAKVKFSQSGTVQVVWPDNGQNLTSRSQAIVIG